MNVVYEMKAPFCEPDYAKLCFKMRQLKHDD